MGAEAILLLKGVEAVGNLFAGSEKASAEREEAKAVRLEGEVEYQDAIKEADLSKERGEQFLAQQAMGFGASGIKLAGSPLDILKKTQEGITEEFTGRLSRADKVKGLRDTQAQRLEKQAGGTEAKGVTKALFGLLS